jgi:hypothetical protein
MSERVKRIIAIFFAINLFFDCAFPTMAMALTGGPSQPEVQAFTPVGTSDMVNMFTGDFNYNIPLLDVEGYPVNLAYDAGISNDQEASWVGLGWNINPGTVNRNKRGLPDDFNGDVIHKELNMKPNQTFGTSFGVGFELFGVDPGKAGAGGGLNLSFGLNYNTYNGYGVDMNANMSLSYSSANKDKNSLAIGMSSGTGKGLGISADYSYSKSIDDKKDSKEGNSFSSGLGLAYNSAGGLQSLNFSMSYARTQTNTKEKMGKDGKMHSKQYTSSAGINGGHSYSFANPTYMPYSGTQMVNMGLGLNFSLGAEAAGSNPSLAFNGWYSGQFIKDKTSDFKGYGYMFAENGNGGSRTDLLHDFNREKDGSFTLNTPNLPVTNFSYDVFSYTGQGIGGNFRAHRNDVGTVFDPYVKNFPDLNANIGVELGAGYTVKVGVNVSLATSNTKCGKWESMNSSESKARFNGNPGGFHENVYFKQGGEKTAEMDQGYFDNIINGFEPVRFDLTVHGAETECTNVLVGKFGSKKAMNPSIKNVRTPRNESMTVLDGDKAKVVGLEKSILTYGYNNFAMFHVKGSTAGITPIARGNVKGHHISEISTVRDDGARYFYGIPIYNNLEKQVTFAVEQPTSDINYRNGLVKYTPNVDNTTNNSKALDHYCSIEETPEYTHSYLLNAVVSSDYVDRTNDGLTPDDLGKYTKFNYTQVHANYEWRSPYSKDSASVNEGIRSQGGAAGDDKASYTYGKKEIWLLHSIETKNYVAVFELDDRLDAFGAADQHGGYSSSTSAGSKLLKEIRLYSRQELLDNTVNAVPLKTVHFGYDYSLCPGVENNSNYGSTTAPITDQGKLTLKEVWFTYQKSEKGKLSPYQFVYADNNHSSLDGNEANFVYNSKSYDRWANYKPNVPIAGYTPDDFNNLPLTSEFPYTDQVTTGPSFNYTYTADFYAPAWNLTLIKLPSGGEIKVTYESDDYAFVQDKRAMQMFRVDGTSDTDASFTPGPMSDLYTVSGLSTNNHNYVFATLDQSALKAISDRVTKTGESQASAIRNLLFRDENGHDIDHMYFRFLMNVERNTPAYNKKYENINGYAKIDYGYSPGFATGSTTQIVFKLREEPVFDNIDLLSTVKINPISMAGINFVRKYMPRVAYDNNQDPFTSAGSNVLALATAIKSSFTPIVQFFKGGIANALRLGSACSQFQTKRSFVRLYNPTQFKKGGGCRVKVLTLNDKWPTLNGNPVSSATEYGQEYFYTTKDKVGITISSGVAAYEPLIGGEENPFRQPVFYQEKHILAPDDDYYHEEPYGESMFPGASVGYSRIVVRNLTRTDFSGREVRRHATGATVHEFYTAKDFPTKATRTDLKKERHKPNPVAKFLKFFVRDYMTTSQGFQIVLNDMHGKQKAQWVYKEPDASIDFTKSLDEYYGKNYISGIEYKYKQNLPQKELDNQCLVIKKTGQIENATVGVDYDMVVDSRESTTDSKNFSARVNVDMFLIAAIPCPIPTLWPGYNQEKVRYRSSTVTKVLLRYGLLEETIAYDNGASVSTRNKLWDAETGGVVLTETVNNFDDQIYNLTYPAHWAYDRMGPAYKNINARTAISGGNAVTPQVLTIGDEVYLGGSTPTMGWVLKTTPSVVIIDKNGATINLSNYGTAIVTRSGNRNQQNIPVAKMTSLVNPLVTTGNVTTLVTNVNSKVINASAAEFKDDWGIFCNCGTTAGSTPNPFLTGQKGIFRPSASYVYLTGREQNKKNNNTNIRKDGPFNSYSTFWAANSTATPYNWTKTTDPSWQLTTQMTVYSPYGFEIENKDALGRSSAAIYGYGNTLPIAVSSNAQYSQIGFDGFEDYDYNDPCDDNHFSYIFPTGGIPYNKSTNNAISKPSSPNQKYSHTGRKSYIVPSGGSVKISNVIKPCRTNPPSIIIY